MLERVRELIGASDEEIAAAAAAAVPASAQTVSAHVVTAESAAVGRQSTVTAVTRGIEEWGLGGGIVSTAAPAAAAVRLLARGALDAAGAMAPERCVSPTDLFPELERRNCRFEVKTEELTR